MITQILGTIREFKTAQFHVIIDALEDYDLDLSWDETGEVLKKLENGEYISFTARCRVIHNKIGEIGSDYLGGCIHSSIDDFIDHRQCGTRNRQLRKEGSNAVCGSYFGQMIKQAITEARFIIICLKEINIRT